MTDDKKYNIEDFWPGAEELLDQHFQKKRGWTSLVKSIGLGLLIASICSTIGYYYYSSTSGKVESALVSQSHQNVNDEKKTVISNETKETNSSSKSSEPNLPIDSHISTNQQDLINSKNAEKSIVPKPYNSNNYNEIDELNSSTSSENGSKTRSIYTAINSNSNAKRKNNLRDNNISQSVIPAAESSTNEKFAENSKQEKYQKFSNDQLNIRSQKEIQIIKLNTIHAQLSNAALFNSSEISPLKSKELSDLGSIVLPEESQNEKKLGFIKASAGLSYLSKVLSSPVYSNYISRRKEEESAAFFSSYSLHFGMKLNRISISTGIELNQYGERIDYSDWLLGDIENINPVVNYFSDSLMNTVYYYIQGNEFNQTNFIYFTDSLVSFDTSITQGQIAKDLSTFESKTMLSYFEVPMLFDYSIFQKRNLTISLNTGISLGFLRATRGFYLNPELDEVFELKNNDSFRKTILNGRIGACVSWNIAGKTSLFVQPNFRFNLQSTFNKNANINQRYNAIGLQFGVMKGF